MSEIKKNEENKDDLTIDTPGGEMPDADRKLSEKASDAAEVFKEDEEKKPAVVKKAG